MLSGNRNFAGRIHPLVPASYLASPALVVAYAIAGTVLTDLSREPLGNGKDGKAVMLADIWPADEEIAALLSHVTADKYQKAYRGNPVGHADWSAISTAIGAQFPWAPGSTFITPSPLDVSAVVQPDQDLIVDMRALAILGDGITTDTLSPNGEILAGTPAALFLAEHGVKSADFGNYAARRGSFEIAVRGMFTNPHIENEMVAGQRGPYTLLLPDGRQTTIFDAGMAYITRRNARHDRSGQRLWQRVFSRLGGEGRTPSRCPGRPGGILRTHSPRKPRRCRHSAGHVCSGNEPEDPPFDRA